MQRLVVHTNLEDCVYAEGKPQVVMVEVPAKKKAQ